MSKNAIHKTRARYNRIAPVYDLMEAVIERLAFRTWRRCVWSHVDGDRVLELGIGTGKNIPYHPRGARIVGVDISDRMLVRAARRARGARGVVDLVVMDAERLACRDASFDAAVASFVFCSVPGPVQGMMEAARPVKQGGRVVLLEHVRVNAPIVGTLMDLLDPLIVRLMGPHINRRTVDNVRKAGLEIERVEPLVAGGLVKLILARANGD